MPLRNPFAPLSTSARRWAKVPAGALALTMFTLGAGLTATALPAYGDVTTNGYTISAPAERSVR